MPSVSKKQQKFMGIVRAIQKGEADPSDFNKDAQDAAKKMKKSSVKKYAKTKHKGLPNKKVNEGRVLHFTKIKDKTLEKHLKVIAKKVGATVSKISGGFKVDADNDGRKLAQVVDYIFDKSLKKGLTSGGGMSRVQVVNESNGSKRDYKAEYKKFQSSPKAKKYRAELNKYNRQKGTYGNGDGKDASHKGGKIVGFEKESTNRGRAEKSRLKKEINDYVGSIIDETINENPAAIAAAQRMVVQSKGNKVSVNTARNSRYKDKDPAAHKKAKSMFQKILDKFRKKNESINEGGMELKKLEDAIKFFKKKIEKQGRVTNARDEEHLERLMKVYNDMGGKKIKENNELFEWLQEACWKGYEKKGMKTMFGKRYPNCVKKTKSESVNENNMAHVYSKDLDKKKFKDLGLYLSNVLDLNPRYDFKLTSNKKLLAINVDKINPKSLQNIKKKFGVDLQQLAKESVNEFKTIYNKNKAAMKIRSLQRDKNAKVYKVDKKRTNYQGKNLIVYNLLTKNKNHSTNQNPYGLDMMKGAYLIPVEEDIKKDSGLDHNQVMTKFISDAMKKAGIRIIKVDMMKKGRFGAPEGDQWYGAFFTVASSNMTDMPGQGKVKRSSAVLPIYVDKKGNLDLRVAPKKFIIGKYPNMNQVVKTLKSFKKSDLEEFIKKNMNERDNVGMAYKRTLAKVELKKIKDAIEMFQKKIKKQGRVTNARDEEHLKNLIKVYKQMGGTGVKESVNENISDSQKFKIYNSLKKGDIVSIKYDSSIGKGSKFHPFLVTKGKTKLMKGKIERIIMVPASGSKAKRYLYNRGGRISLALGDMAASIVDMKKGEVNEGSCGYGVDGKLGEEPAGPHLLKKKKKKNEIATRNRKHLNKFSKAQIDKLRKSYGTLKGINPSSPTYKKLVYMLDSLPLANLKQLEKAKIPFISGLARNRVYRAKKFGSTTGG